MDLAVLPALGGEVDLVSIQGGEFIVTDPVACIRDATGRERHSGVAGGQLIRTQ